MHRWNGWGDTKIDFPLPEMGKDFLLEKVGEPISPPPPDVTWDETVASLTPSRLPDHPLFDKKAETRILFSRGQSTPDWIALRGGLVDTFPDAVAFPNSSTQVAEVLSLAQKLGASVIPYGGGTSVVGHINPEPGDKPVITVSMKNLTGLLELDQKSSLARLGCGTSGTELELILNAKGFTLGHFPQSFEQSTLGGWIAARSSGQQSFHYGRIEDLFAGGHLETPRGSWDLVTLPASSAGPDLKEIVLGSEGRLGIITHATMRLSRMPEVDKFWGALLPNWEAGINAVRTIAQAQIPVSMLRLSDAVETVTSLALSGHTKTLARFDWLLGRLNLGEGRCLLLLGVTGSLRGTKLAQHEAMKIVRAHGGFPPFSVIGRPFGKAWVKNRYLAPYLRNTLWEQGYVVDTLETAVPWTQIPKTGPTLEAALNNALPEPNEKIHAMAHLSHIYPDGASTYVTYVFRRCRTPRETLKRWQLLKDAASQAVVSLGGTISHQHGVGVDHRPYLAKEKGPVGMELLEAMQKTVDPHEIMNPGKLLASPKAVSKS